MPKLHVGPRPNGYKTEKNDLKNSGARISKLAHALLQGAATACLYWKFHDASCNCSVSSQRCNDSKYIVTKKQTQERQTHYLLVGY